VIPKISINASPNTACTRWRQGATGNAHRWATLERDYYDIWICVNRICRYIPRHSHSASFPETGIQSYIAYDQ
jgi:hypothetical protein